ncbi:RidA family protein [Bacteroidota bacterium]
MKKAVVLFSLILMILMIHAQDNPEPKPVAPYSPSVMTGDGLLFISGQIAINPETNTIMKGDIENETRVVMERISAILEKNNMEFSNLVKCTVFLTDIRDYKAVNKVYASFFEDGFPAREAIEVSNLPLGASIEISGIASKR